MIDDVIIAVALIGYLAFQAWMDHREKIAKILADGEARIAEADARITEAARTP